MRIWQNGRKSSISYDREFGKKYDGNLVLYKKYDGNLVLYTLFDECPGSRDPLTGSFLNSKCIANK
jgi:hypothetical protein